MSITKAQKQKLKSVNYLDLTPIKLLSEEADESRNVSLLIPKFTNKFLVNYLVPRLKSPYIKLKLDELGSESWLQIDGNKNVSEISDILVNKFGERIQPANERLTKFLTELFTHKFISFRELNKS
jgi:hypothetical protein